MKEFKGLIASNEIEEQILDYTLVKQVKCQKN